MPPTSDVPLAVRRLDTGTFIIDQLLQALERRGDIGYIRISSLNENTIAKLNAALRQLQRQIGGRKLNSILRLARTSAQE